MFIKNLFSSLSDIFKGKSSLFNVLEIEVKITDNGLLHLKTDIKFSI